MAWLVWYAGVPDTEANTWIWRRQPIAGAATAGDAHCTCFEIILFGWLLITAYPLRLGLMVE